MQCISSVTNRTIEIKINRSFSAAASDKYRVPQGYVFGLILPTLYTSPHTHITQQHGLDFYLYPIDIPLHTPIAKQSTNVNGYLNIHDMSLVRIQFSPSLLDNKEMQNDFEDILQRTMLWRYQINIFTLLDYKGHVYLEL